MAVVVEIVRIEVPLLPGERVIVELLRDRLGPAGDAVAARLIVPTNPWIDDARIVDVPEEPCAIVRLPGSRLIEKSGVLVPNTVTIVDRDLTSFPLK